MLAVFTIEDIRNFDPKPCEDPLEYLPEDWEGTAIDILDHPKIAGKDKIWVCCHDSVLSKDVLSRFEKDCSSQINLLLRDQGYTVLDVLTDSKPKGVSLDSIPKTSGLEAWGSANAAGHAAWFKSRGTGRAAGREAEYARQVDVLRKIINSWIKKQKFLLIIEKLNQIDDKL